MTETADSETDLEMTEFTKTGEWKGAETRNMSIQSELKPINILYVPSIKQ